MDTFEILDQLEATSSRLEKEALLKQHLDHEDLKRAFVYAMDPYKTFGVIKFKMPAAATPSKTEISKFFDMPGGPFYQLLDQLAVRSLTGNAAKAALVDVFSGMTALEQKWCQRILMQKLRCGVDTTINKMWPGLVPSFEVQLAAEVETTRSRDAFQIVPGEIKYPAYVDPKLDGLRMIAVKEAGVVTLYSRGGQVFENFPTITKALEGMAADNIVFDGEALAATWNDTQSVAFSKKDDSQMVYNVFDCMPSRMWRDHDCALCYEDRMTLLQSLLPKHDVLDLVRGKIVADEAELLAFYEQCIAQGYEGIMVKDLTAPYVFARSKAVRKLKPVATYEGVITGFYRGNLGSPWFNGFGGFVVRLPGGAETKVGGGFSKAQRVEFCGANARVLRTVEAQDILDPGAMMGRVVECEGQAPLSADGKIRFPVFIRFREDTDVDPLILAERL